MKLKRILAFILVLGLVFPSVLTHGDVAHGQEEISYDYLNTDNQSVSKEEKVYPNDYSSTERSQNFDRNWKFISGDQEGAEGVNYDDSDWRNIDLPHDFSIEKEYTKSGEAESGYLLGGTGWYRKSFFIPESEKDNLVSIDFDGVYMETTVYVNGNRLGIHPYGYSPFSFDITKYLNYGEENIIAVKVVNNVPTSRWYSGSGIYRSVNLTITDKLHISEFGTKIETPNLKEEVGGEVSVKVDVDLENKTEENKDVKVKHIVYERENPTAIIGEFTSEVFTVNANSSHKITNNFKVNNPKLWSTDDPNLYTVETQLLVDDEVVDSYKDRFGFRYFEFDRDTGFSLNGKKMKLQGVCMHHDQGSLGSRNYKRAVERQFEILKEMGANAVRVTHNPASANLLEVADELGILIIEEFFDGWHQAKNGNRNDYSLWFNENIGEDNEIVNGNSNMKWHEFDLTQTVKRGQNYPSIIMWSIGNEVMEGTAGLNNLYPSVAEELTDLVVELDNTRPVTMGDNKFKESWSESIEMNNYISSKDGIVGLNYANGYVYDKAYRNYPTYKIYGAETASAINSRGVYDRLGDPNNHAAQTSDGMLTSYDLSKVGWGEVASSAWYDVIKRDYVAGEFVWTGFDYIGEPTPWNGVNSGQVGRWPSPKNSYFGIIDTAGFPKDTYYFYQSQWNELEHTLHILPAWNEDVVKKDLRGRVPVVVYTDAYKVELKLNDELIGEKTFTEVETDNYKYQIYTGDDKSRLDHQNLYFSFDVEFKPGKLEAIAYDKDGNVIENTVGRNIVYTTGEPAELKVSVDRDNIMADGHDLSYIEVDIVDENGNIVPNADNNVKFEVVGEGTLEGVDNGKQNDHQSYQDDNRNAHAGKVLGIVKSTYNAGTITVKISSPELGEKTVEINTQKVDDGNKSIDYFVYPKNYYVNIGNEVLLPEKVKAVYSDGSESIEKVQWDEIDSKLFDEVGSFNVIGKTENNSFISANVFMISTVGGVLNVSLTTPKGVVPELPNKRPIVLADGTILTNQADVEWEEVDSNLFDEAGIVEVNGTAKVREQEFDVLATIRVQDVEVEVGSNIAFKNSGLTQNIPEDLQSDTLEAIVDGSIEVSDNNEGGANKSAWTNYNNSQAGNDTAEIVFAFATQQNFGQFKVFFFRDGYSARFPLANTTEFYVSESGTEGTWNKVDTTETISDDEVSNRVKEYSYDFAPVTATFVKLVVKNNPEELQGRKTCTGITEVELYTASTSIDTYNTADFESITINGKDIEEEFLSGNEYNIEALKAVVEAKSKENASVTILPQYEGKIKIILESEDHEVRNIFTINLGIKEQIDPADDSKDYPYENMRIEVGNEDPYDRKEGAIDNDHSTWWHTDWYNAAPLEERWATLILDEPQMVEGLRYLPRNDGNVNGMVKEYVIEVSLDGEEFTEVAKGTWYDNVEWKIAEFEPVLAKYVRIRGIHTYGDGNQADKFMTANELRVRIADNDLIDITDKNNNVEATLESNEVVVNEVSEDNPVEVKVTVTKDGKELTEGVDYVVIYEDNTSEGPAKAIVKGISQYTGEIVLPFNIVVETEEEVDKDELQKLIEDANSILLDKDEYTEESTNRLIAALNSALKVLNDKKATKEDVTMAVAKLKDALARMEKIEEPSEVDKSKLKELISYAKDKLMEEDKYTMESLNKLDEAVKAAEKVLDNTDATLEDVKNAEDMITKAIAGLEEIPSEPGTKYGWQKENDYWYYYKDGKKVVDKWIWVGVDLDGDGIEDISNWKYFDKSGRNQTTFYIDGDNVWLSQAGPDKEYLRGWWTNEAGMKYYFRKSSGTRVEGKQWIDGSWKYFRSSGTLLTGWQYVDGGWRFFKDDGTPLVDKWAWLPIDVDGDGNYDKHNWKYFNKEGINQITFYIDGGNVWLSQIGPYEEYYKGWWTNESGMKYYFRETSGSRVQGWQFIDGSWRYFRTTGTMVTGRQFIDNKWYIFRNDGSLIGKR